MKTSTFFGVALLAAAALFSACSDNDDPKPALSFEERNAAFQTAFANDPQRHAKLKEVNTEISRLFEQLAGEEVVESWHQWTCAHHQEFAKTKGFTLSEYESNQFRLYWGCSHLYQEIEMPSDDPVVTFDMLSENTQAFVNSLSQQEMDALEKKIRQGHLQRIVSVLAAANTDDELYKRGAEQFVKLAKEYGIEFSIDEGVQLLKMCMEAYLPTLYGE